MQGDPGGTRARTLADKGQGGQKPVWNKAIGVDECCIRPTEKGNGVIPHSGDLHEFKRDLANCIQYIIRFRRYVKSGQIPPS
jgi:hypothetical protein